MSVLFCHVVFIFNCFQMHYHPEIHHLVLGIPKLWAPSSCYRFQPLCTRGTQLLPCSGKTSFSSALKSSQFPFPLWRNFSFFFKFQPENPSQHLPEKLYRKGLSSLWINQHWPDRMNRGKEKNFTSWPHCNRIKYIEKEKRENFSIYIKWHFSINYKI